MRLLDRAVRTARSNDDARLEAHALAWLGRHHLLVDDVDAAQRVLTHALDIIRAIGWTSFRALPEALLADITRRRGDLDRARVLSEQAVALAEQVGDLCWEAAALRSLGLVAIDAGDVDHGVELLQDAPVQCRRLPDTYRWMELWGYDALVTVAGGHDLPGATVWARRLETEAAALGMRPFAERARRYSMT